MRAIQQNYFENFNSKSMKIPFVDLYGQYLSIKSEIDQAIANVIEDSAFVRSQYVDDFEREFAAHVGVQHCVSCANGTDALYIAMRALGIESGDEVITTAHSWISTSETITQAGGRVVFCDTDDKTFTIDVGQIEDKVNSNTVGIIPVHLYGQPADMDVILAIAKKYNLWVVEDCAQAHDAVYKGKKVGTMGDIGTFSFYPGKNLGAMGDAGCLTINSNGLADKAQNFARHGGKGIHLIEGVNSRLDGLQAAILSVKLSHLKMWTNNRQRLAEAYSKKLAGLDSLTTPFLAKDREHVYHLYVIKSAFRNDLKKYLLARGISTVINYPRALPFYPAYDYLNHMPSDFPNAVKNQGEILSLPLFPEMTDLQQDYVVENIRNFFY